MQLQQDGPGHLYADVGNIRITYIPANDRAADKNWAGSDVIRIQSYKSVKDRALHPGAELPIKSPEEFGEFVAAICQVYVEGRQ